MKRVILLPLAILLVVSFTGIGNASSIPYVLTDLNSTAKILDSSPGMYEWEVDNKDLLAQQWFWYRYGSMTKEDPLNALGFINAKLSDVNSNPGDDTLNLQYGNSDFTVTVTYLLTGGSMGSGVSDIVETISIINISATAQTITFFQYTDFDLTAIPNDTAYLANANTVVQNGSDTFLTETVVTPAPNRYEINYWHNTVDSLNDTSITNLNNHPGPLTGDVTWAFQWDLDIGAGKTVIISKDKLINPVPVPPSVLLLGSGLLGLGAVGWRKKRR